MSLHRLETLDFTNGICYNILYVIVEVCRKSEKRRCVLFCVDERKRIRLRENYAKTKYRAQMRR